MTNPIVVQPEDDAAALAYYDEPVQDNCQLAFAFARHREQAHQAGEEAGRMAERERVGRFFRAAEMLLWQRNKQFRTVPYATEMWAELEAAMEAAAIRTGEKQEKSA